MQAAISAATLAAMPPRRISCPATSDPSVAALPPRGIAPSAHTTIEKCRPASSRAMTLSHTFWMSNGISGIRITSADPEMPE